VKTRTPPEDSPAVKELRAAIRVARERLRDADTYQTIKAAETSIASLDRALLDAIEAQQPPKKRRGFATLPEEHRRAVAQKGGRSAHAKGKAHEFTHAEAQAAGAKGGAVSRGGRGRLPADPGVEDRSAAVASLADAIRARIADAESESGGSDDGEPRP
jgi:hypothetical protein